MKLQLPAEVIDLIEHHLWDCLFFLTLLYFYWCFLVSSPKEEAEKKPLIRWPEDSWEIKRGRMKKAETVLLDSRGRVEVRNMETEWKTPLSRRLALRGRN